MTCAELEDRLFDEDCRDALLGRASMPADAAAHAGLCPACSRRWAEAAAEARLLSRRLVVAPPPRLPRSLYGAFRPRTLGGVPGIDADALSWTIAGASLGASLAGAALSPPGSHDWAGFCVGAGVGAVIAAVLSARRSGLGSWRDLRDAASHHLARLGRVV